jgi:Novel STAND NTPase 1
VLAIIASSWFFDQVIRHAAPDVSRAYRPVLVRAKDDTQRGWICLPDRPPGPATSPYKGLRAFEKEDQDLFFGRERRAAAHGRGGRIGARAGGRSVGIGKSSLVQAGLLPRLEQGRTSWGVQTILPRPDLPMALAAALARLSGAPPAVPPPQLETWQNYLSVHGLAAAAEKACTQDHRWEHAVIVVDQFEEALVEDGGSGPVLRQLGDLRDGGILTVVLTLRGDSFGRFFESQESFGNGCGETPSPCAAWANTNCARPSDARLSGTGVRSTGPLVEELVEAIRDRPGALPLLEFSLDQMWRTLPRGQLTLSSDEYRRIRGLNGALSAHADQVLNSLTDAERALVRSLFVTHLTSVDQPDVRRVIRRSDCDSGYWPVIVRLADERLLTVGCDEHGHQTAEVVHEALLRAWNQLHVWLDAERPFRRWRQRLREDMKPWLETGDSRELMTGSPLAIAERWRKDREDDLDLDELRYITASVSLRTEQEERYRTLYGRARAREWTHRAESAQDPQLALLYALEVLKLSPDAQADRLVRACLHRVKADEILEISRRGALEAADRFGQRLTLAEWSRGPGPGGHWLLGDPATGLVIGEDGQARYRAGTETPMPGPVAVAACTRAGVACLVTEAGQLALWQLADDSDQAEKLGEGNLGVSVACAAVNDTGQTVVAACGDGKIRVLDGKGLREVADLPFDGFVRDIDVSTDPDRRVAALGRDRRLRVWDLVTRDLLCESVTALPASRIAIAPGQKYVMAGEVRTGAVGRFALSADILRMQAQQAANRELTADERAGLDDPPA